jgi:hypothetical protein
LLQLDAVQRRDKGINILVCVVKCKRGSDRAFKPEPAQDRLGAVMARAHRNAFTVKCGANILASATVEDKGDHTGLFRGGSDYG